MTLSNLDLISFCDGLIARMRFGKMRRIGWVGATGGAVERLLRARGIHVYGRRLESDEIRSALVVEKQADWATDIIWKAGIAIVQGDRRPRGARDGWSRELPTPWGVQRRRTIIETIYDGIAASMGIGEPAAPRRQHRTQRRRR